MEFEMKRKLNPEMISIKDAQKFLNISKKELNNLIESGEITTLKSGSHIRILKESLVSIQKNSITFQHANINVCSNASVSEIAMIADWT